MEDDSFARRRGQKQENEVSEDDVPRPANACDGEASELLAPDLLAACMDNDTSRAQDLLASGVPHGYLDPESGICSNTRELSLKPHVNYEGVAFFGWSCVHWAVYNGNPILTQALVRAGACSSYKKAPATLSQGRRMNKNSNRRTSVPSRTITDTPLHWAAFRGDLRITWLLLSEGYYPNDADTMGNTATHLAAANGHERVLDTLIRDGADVHRQNNFKNKPFDVANSAGCRDLLEKAAMFPAPRMEEAERMHAQNLQRIISAEEFLKEAMGDLDGQSSFSEGQQQQQGRGQLGEGIGMTKPVSSMADVSDRRPGGEPLGGVDADCYVSDGQNAKYAGHATSAIVETTKEPRDPNQALCDLGQGESGGSEGQAAGSASGDDSLAMLSASEITKRDRMIDEQELRLGGEVVNDGADDAVAYEEDNGDRVLAQVETIREAVAGAEALCICDELVAAAKLKIDSLLLQHSIEKQAARIAAASPVLMQGTYTTLVNRLILLLRRAEGNSRITDKLRRRAKALVEKSHAEYWLQVAAHRLETVDCAYARHMGDMAKLETCLEQALKSGAHMSLVERCRFLLRRLSTEVEINEALESFPQVRLPIEVMPKDYWQPEDIGFVEETEGFPLPPSDEEGKPMDYIWIPSQSLRVLSAACARMSGALAGAQEKGVNPSLVERGSKRLNEAQKEVRVLQEKDTVDREKAVAVAAKAAKKLKKKGKGKKKK